MGITVAPYLRASGLVTVALVFKRWAALPSPLPLRSARVLVQPLPPSPGRPELSPRDRLLRWDPFIPFLTSIRPKCIATYGRLQRRRRQFIARLLVSAAAAAVIQVAASQAVEESRRPGRSGA